MRRPRCVFSFKSAMPVVVALFGCSCMDVREQADKELSAHIARVHESAPRWYASGSSDSLAGLYAPDATIFVPNGAPISGADAINTHWSSMFAGSEWDVSMTTVELRVTPPTAVERGVYRVSVTFGEADTTTITDIGNYIVVWNYGLDGWRIQYDVAMSEKRLKD